MSNDVPYLVTPDAPRWRKLGAWLSEKTGVEIASGPSAGRETEQPPPPAFVATADPLPPDSTPIDFDKFFGGAGFAGKAPQYPRRRQ